jgi:hypothetical protein
MKAETDNHNTLKMALIIIVLAAVLLGATFLALLPSSADAAELDRETKAAIIDSVRFHLDKTYIFAETAEKMGKALSKNLKKGKYDDLNDLDAFTRRMTVDMEEISHDRHLWVFPASEDEIRIARQDEPSDDDLESRIAQQAYTNFGFEKVEILSNNIGYLKFNQFEDAKYAGETAVAAMNFLANCDAVIIDLRENGGGSPTMVQLISSYFFDEATHLNNFYIREADTIKQFWTQSHVEGPSLADKPLYVLTARRTFSGAEEFAYNMKNLERATIIGETTGGGAHPTTVVIFPDLGTKMGVPFGRAVNPITMTNWEGTGVEPDIKVPQEEALDVAIYEALKKASEEAEDPQVKTRLTWALERLETIREPFEVDENTLKSYVGKYGPRTVLFEDGNLYYQREERPKFRMYAISETLFCFDELDFFRIEVVVGNDGVPTMLRGHYNNGRVDVTERDVK